MYDRLTQKDCALEIQSINGVLEKSGTRYKLRIRDISDSISVIESVGCSCFALPGEQLSPHLFPGELLQWLRTFKKGLHIGVAVSAKTQEPTPASAATEHLETIEQYIDHLGCQVANARSNILDWGDVGDLVWLADSLKEISERYNPTDRSVLQATRRLGMNDELVQQCLELRRKINGRLLHVEDSIQVFKRLDGNFYVRAFDPLTQDEAEDSGELPMSLEQIFHWLRGFNTALDIWSAARDTTEPDARRSQQSIWRELKSSMSDSIQCDMLECLKQKMRRLGVSGELYTFVEILQESKENQDERST